jgi:DNA-binding CsgD family transcriptional regulator
MTAASPLIPIRDTEALVDAINQAVEIEGDSFARITYMLRTLQRLMQRDVRCALWMLDELERDPMPRIHSRTIVLPQASPPVPSTIDDAQRAFDTAAPVTRQMLHTVLRTLRTPCTLIVSEAAEPQWFEDVLVKRLVALTGTVDCIISMWASSEDHAIFLIVHRSQSDPAFRGDETTMVSLMLRAVAPFADRAMAERAMAGPHEDLSPREREVLLMLLGGDSEKQVAAGLSRSINTVHTFVRQIYRRYNVSSRGELMAQFVDQAVLARLRDGDAKPD